MSIVSRYKPHAVFTEQVVDNIWRDAQKRPLLGGEILDRIYGNSPDRPTNAHEAVRQLNEICMKKYGRRLMSTTAYRAEAYEDEKAQRRV
jgi:hypothetical protein